MKAAYKNFTGGEVTPTLSARYDLQKFGSFLLCCENFIPNIHGDLERRPGTRYIGQFAGEKFLLPFSFNTDQVNNYVLAFSGSDVIVLDENGNSYATLACDYSLADLPYLSYAQSGDILYMAHKNYALRKLTRSGVYPYSWAIQDVAFNQSLSTPTGVTVTWWRGPTSSTDPTPYTQNETYQLAYRITAVDADGVESLASSRVAAFGRYPSDWVQGDFVLVQWDAVSGASQYNIYRESAGYYGFVGTKSSSSTSFQDENFIPDTSITPKKNWWPFASGNNPATICFHQQRLVIGGTKNNPATIYMSRAGDFENFRKSFPLRDDDPIEYMLASGSIDEIKWMVSFGELLVGTAGCEYKVTSNGAAITPSDVLISTQSFWGSSGIKPIVIGNSILHCQRNGHHVRDLHYSWETDGYKGNDLSVLAPDLVDGYTIKQWAFQQSPGNNVWAVRSDGTLLCLTYMQEQNIFAWSRHTTQGYIKSCSVISGNGQDVLMLVVQRLINGSWSYFLEKMAIRFDDTQTLDNAYFVDCGYSDYSATETKTFSGFTWLANMPVDVLADGNPERNITVNGSGVITINHPANRVQVGLNYQSVMCPLPLEADMQGGSSLGTERSYGKVTLRLYRTIGGKYAGTKSGDLFNRNVWQSRSFYEIPFLPAYYDISCLPFSGDIDISLPSGKDSDTMVWIKQDKPLPFRVIAVICDVNF